MKGDSMWVSKKKFDELKERVNKLDPENVRKDLREATNNISSWKIEATQEVMKAINEKTELISTRLEGLVNKVTEQDKKIEEFISSTQKITKVVLSRISELVEEISALIVEKPKDPEKIQIEGGGPEIVPKD